MTMTNNDWPEGRMDIIGQNGPTGEHYEAAEELDLLRRERDLLKQKLAAVGRERDELAAHCERLKTLGTACANELVWMINRHNVQSEVDGSWLFDGQTPCDLMTAINATPAQSLAAVKARAVREAADQCEFPAPENFMCASICSHEELHDYANKLEADA